MRIKPKKRLDEVTVFVISTGEDTLKDCLQSLEEQDCIFQIKHIVDVFPMSRAFQNMPDRADTRFFIQVDADMILEPHAVRTLYEAACSSGLFTCVIYGQLFEEGFGVGGSVRLWKKNMFNFFSFRDCRTVDRDLFSRIKFFGFRKKNLNTVLGIHRPRHSEFSEYLKTKSDIEKWRFLRRSPEKYAKELFGELIHDCNENSYRLFGFLLGGMTLKSRLVRSKDLSVEKKRFKDFLKLLGYPDDELLKMNQVPDKTKLWEIFSRCYKQYRKVDPKYRKELSGIMIGMYGYNGAAECDFEQFCSIANK